VVVVHQPDQTAGYGYTRKSLVFLGPLGQVFQREGKVNAAAFHVHNDLALGLKYDNDMLGIGPWV